MDKIRQRRYEQLARELLAANRIHLAAWNSTMRGQAWEELDSRGHLRRCISAPKPRSPQSLALVLHEIGHHVLGLGRFPVCWEEYLAWQWSFAQMHLRSIHVNENVVKLYRRLMGAYLAQASVEQRREIGKSL